VKLRRSFAFWAGVLVMGFLLWAWQDSLRHGTRWAAGRYEGHSSRGGVLLLRNDRPSAQGIDRGPLGWGGEGSSLPRPFLMRGQGVPDTQTCATVNGETLWEIYREVMPYKSRGAWVAYVPYWLMVAVAGAGWGAVMLWRARRLRRVRAQGRVAGSTMDAVV
jgi:hypothetical protein